MFNKFLFSSPQPDIVTFQETFSEESAPWVTELKHSQHHEILFSHGYSRSRGVLLAFRKNSNINIQSYHCDKQGHFIVAHVCIRGEPITIAALYLEPTLRATEYSALLSEIVSHVAAGENSRVIFCGDFNAVLNPKLDCTASFTHPQKHGKILQDFIDVQDLTDVWRTEHPETK